MKLTNLEQETIDFINNHCSVSYCYILGKVFCMEDSNISNIVHCYYEANKEYIKDADDILDVFGDLVTYRINENRNK